LARRPHGRGPLPAVDRRHLADHGPGPDRSDASHATVAFGLLDDRLAGLDDRKVVAAITLLEEDAAVGKHLIPPRPEERVDLSRLQSGE
jgi:hypothetical protein